MPESKPPNSTNPFDVSTVPFVDDEKGIRTGCDDVTAVSA
jgi:hypothetical protein